MLVEEITLLNEKMVLSSWIKELTYNRPRKILTMSLLDGKKYLIHNISRRQFDNWNNANSKGQFFHTNVKDRYDIQRVS